MTLPSPIREDNSDGRLERSRRVARLLADNGVSLADLVDQLLMRKRLHLIDYNEVLFDRDLSDEDAQKYEEYVERKMATSLGVYLRNHLMIEWTKRSGPRPGTTVKRGLIAVLS